VSNDVARNAGRPRTPELLVAQQEQLPLGATKKIAPIFLCIPDIRLD
jgi:hypothetical protein